MDDPVAFRVLNEIGIIEQLGRTMFERVMPLNLTLSQFIVLNHFVRLGGTRSPHQLARAFQVTKATMTSTLQRLQAKGLILVEPDPRDGRAKLVSLTPAGRDARNASIAAIGPALAAMEAHFGKAELATALPFLVRLRTYLDERRSEDLKPGA